jgi:hypothetical protein
MATTAKQTIVINTINAAVCAYKQAHEEGLSALATMRTAIKGSGLPLEHGALAQPLMQSMADAYGIVLVDKVRGTGKTWDLESKDKANAKRHNAAKTCYSKLMRELFADTHAQAAAKGKVVISAEARALLQQLDELYDTYPEMRAVCNAYIARATAK